MTDQTADPTKVQEAADAIWRAFEQDQTIAPVRALLGDDLDAAYAAQALNAKRWEAQERKLSGRKIALTSATDQARLGADGPVSGLLFADMEATSHAPIPMDRVAQPKVEAEVAFVISAPLTGEHLTMVELLASIGFVLPALEIAGCRIADRDVRPVDIVADNGGGGAYVLGQTPKRLADFDQRLGGMAMFRNGEPVSFGAGAACMGSPVNALYWLARQQARAGRPLGPGDLVLSGALGPGIAASSGDLFEAEIAGLGSVRARFA